MTVIAYDMVVSTAQDDGEIPIVEIILAYHTRLINPPSSGGCSGVESHFFSVMK
jgi:hypothetical protein